MGVVTGGKGTGQLQEELFAEADSGAAAEPVLMALNAEFYELIWRGLKTHEFRRRFLAGRPVRWFVYLNAPVSRLTAVIDLGPAIVDVPERIAALAEAARPGNGASVLEYVRDLDQAFAIPILHVAEYPGPAAAELRAELGSFHPPQGYARLAQHPQMLAVCEKVAASPPVRQRTVHPRV
jgi:predicted transcriptional regulator